MSKLTAITSDFAKAIEHLGTEHFVPTIAEVLCGLVNADDATVIVYGHEELPTISFARPLAGKEESSLATYLTGPFLLDPFYRAAAYDQQFGVYRLADLAPASFRSSEYYKNWYKHCGYEDECGLLIRLANENFINISIGLTSEGARFRVGQAKLLASIYELTASLCRRHFLEVLEAQKKTTLRERMHRSLAAFGASVLTRRERQVVELVLLGHNTRLIAEKLGISIETVKLHRKHAYAKLDISSQAELFFLFMEALSHWSGDPDTDPLIAYQGGQ
ncbi:MAG: helix-turn-helix transcriptional regulator [Pseudomonadota bacterium]|nr:helix-turn-helix transcriptional regulator [Pseudomonadota bacterium]MEC8007698.1 helix-turn-helix transcriptional regulator [Pseudomonadota bacterium]MEC8528510.1 helix-turn-helix transcriptional regulator [Pseudomonadota bacterium]MEC9122378.1 helix-turn-helix transcriptional regulator [Pseudomonadota bacterium]